MGYQIENKEASKDGLFGVVEAGALVNFMGESFGSCLVRISDGKGAGTMVDLYDQYQEDLMLDEANEANFSWSYDWFTPAHEFRVQFGAEESPDGKSFKDGTALLEGSLWDCFLWRAGLIFPVKIGASVGKK